MTYGSECLKYRLVAKLNKAVLVNWIKSVYWSTFTTFWWEKHAFLNPDKNWYLEFEKNVDLQYNGFLHKLSKS